MSINLDIVMKRPSKIYHEGEMVSGVVLIESKSEFRHDGITLTSEGIVSLQLSPKNAGLFDSIVTTSKPEFLLNTTTELVKGGKIFAGRTELPFELPLQPRPNKILFETYHGLYIRIHYDVRCDIKRSYLAKDITKAQEFIMEHKEGTHAAAVQQRIEFIIKPESIKNIQLTVNACECEIKSIELQLTRLEICGSADVTSGREASEIQNIQIVQGDVCRNLPIPIYMVFPRLFTCATTLAPNFRIEFELNIVITFDNDHLIVETFPIKLTRH